jgi:hypothetical protein
MSGHALTTPIPPELESMSIVSPRTGLRPLLLASSAALGLLVSGGAGFAASGEEMLRTAEAACLDAAVAKGWQRDMATVVSSRAIDADKVELVFDLSRDGKNTARLTCPYSAKQGVMGDLAAVGEKLSGDTKRNDFGKDFTKSMSTAGDAGSPVDRARGWWLLLPVGITAACWGFLRSREGDAV